MSEARDRVGHDVPTPAASVETVDQNGVITAATLELAHRPVVRRDRPRSDEELPVPDEQHPAPVLPERVLERLGDVGDDGAVAVPLCPGDLLGRRGAASRCGKGAIVS